MSSENSRWQPIQIKLCILLVFCVGDIPKDIEEQIDNAWNKLDLKDVDYEATMEAKLRIARQIYDSKDKDLLQVRFSVQSWSSEYVLSVCK